MRKPEKYREEIQILLSDLNEETKLEGSMYNSIDSELMKGIMIGKNMIMKKIHHEFQVRGL
jgi:predicted component of type VI protein secretion system